MKDQELINLLEMRLKTLLNIYDDEHIGRKRAEVIIRTNELNFLIQHIKNKIEEEQK